MRSGVSGLSVSVHQLEFAFNHLLKSLLFVGYKWAAIVLMKMFRVAYDFVKTWKSHLLFKRKKEEASLIRLNKKRNTRLWPRLHFHKCLSLILWNRFPRPSSAPWEDVLWLMNSQNAKWKICFVHMVICPSWKMKETSLFYLNNKW